MQQDVLAGVCTRAFAEQHHPRTVSAPRCRSRAVIVNHNSRFCSRASSILNSDSGDGRFEYCIVTIAMSPRVR